MRENVKPPDRGMTVVVVLLLGLMAGLLWLKFYGPSVDADPPPQMEIEYTYDSRTELCFAEVRGTYTTQVVLVPCSGEVKKATLPDDRVGIGAPKN